MAKGIQSHDYRSGTEMVEAETSIRPLKMVLADGSSASTSFGEEMVLVVVKKTSPDVSNSFRQFELGVESIGEWNSSCLAQFNDFLGMPTTRCEEKILTLLKKWIMRKDQKNRRFGTKRVKVES